MIRWLVPVVLAAACSAPTPGADPTSTTVASVTTSVATTSTTVPATTTTVPAEPKALLSPGGIIVPIRERVAQGWVVGTPCFAEAVLTDATPVPADVQVVIDPGHGGRETGAVGPNGLVERDLNLDVARRLLGWLTDRGIGAVLTRYGDYRMAIPARAELIRTLDPALAISIHHNAGDISPSAEIGATVFHQADHAESRRAAGLAYEELVRTLGPLDLDWVASAPPGAVSAVRHTDDRDAYGILRLSRPVPVILTEPLFLQNRSEAEALATDRVQHLEAAALGAAIERFLTTDAPGSGFLEPRVYRFPVSPTGGVQGCVDPPLE